MYLNIVEICFSPFQCYVNTLNPFTFDVGWFTDSIILFIVPYFRVQYAMKYSIWYCRCFQIVSNEPFASLANLIVIFQKKKTESRPGRYTLFYVCKVLQNRYTYSRHMWDTDKRNGEESTKHSALHVWVVLWNIDSDGELKNTIGCWMVQNHMKKCNCNLIIIIFI